MRFFLYLLWRHLRQYPGRALAALLVLTLASTMMLTLAGVGAALRFRVGAVLDDLFPEERVRLEARRGELGPIAVETRPITPETVDAVGRLAGVRAVHPVEPVRFPIRAQGDFFGTTISSDAIVHGLPRELVDDAIDPGEPWAEPADPARPLPVVASTYFLDLYNLGLARAGGLPLLSPSAVIGRHFILVLGESTVGIFHSDREPTVLRCRLAGFSSGPALLGIALPAEVVRKYNRLYTGREEPTYVQMVVTLEGGAERATFLEAAGELGLRPGSEEAVGEDLKTAVRAGGWIMFALALGAFLMGLLTFYSLFAMVLHARRLDLIRLRALGLGPPAALGLAVGEVGVLALIGVAVAGAINLAATSWLDAYSRELLQRFPSLPPDLFHPAPGWLALALGVILACTILPLTPMLRWVLRVEPADIIRDL